MAKAQIIKENSVQILKNSMLENIERLDAERIVLEAESDMEKSHRQNQHIIDIHSLQLRDCYTKREVFHTCLCEIQENITEIEI